MHSNYKNFFLFFICFNIFASEQSEKTSYRSSDDDSPPKSELFDWSEEDLEPKEDNFSEIPTQSNLPLSIEESSPMPSDSSSNVEKNSSFKKKKKNQKRKTVEGEIGFRIPRAKAIYHPYTGDSKDQKKNKSCKWEQVDVKELQPANYSKYEYNFSLSQSYSSLETVSQRPDGPMPLTAKKLSSWPPSQKEVNLQNLVWEQVNLDNEGRKVREVFPIKMISSEDFTNPLLKKAPRSKKNRK